MRMVLIGRAAGSMAAACALALASAPAAAQEVNPEEVGAICLEGIGLDSPLEAVPMPQRQRILACLNRETARRMNAQAPVAIDAETTLVSVTAENLEMTYTYRFAVDAPSVGAAQQAAAAARIRSGVCANPSMRGAIASGASYQFVSIDRSDRPIQRVRVDRC